MRKKYLHLAVLLFLYIVGYFLCKFYFAQGMPMESYTAGWLFRRSFMYTWVLVILFILFNKPMTATFTTIGCLIGIVVGDVLGGWIKTVRIKELQSMIDSGVEVSGYDNAYAYHHYGILPIWFIVMLIFIIGGLIFDKRKIFKKKIG